MMINWPVRDNRHSVTLALALAQLSPPLRASTSSWPPRPTTSNRAGHHRQPSGQSSRGEGYVESLADQFFHSIPQTAPAGGLTITKPAQTATSYFKISPDNPITFAWNFTYLYVTPQQLTVSALCQNGYSYPVGPTDGIISGDSTSVVWDPYAYNQANPALQVPPAMCTLEICDERGLGAVRQGGVFNPNTALTFALYTPQPYTPLSSKQHPWTVWFCLTRIFQVGNAVLAAAGLIPPRSAEPSSP